MILYFINYKIYKAITSNIKIATFFQYDKITNFLRSKVIYNTNMSVILVLMVEMSSDTIYDIVYTI